MTPWQEHDLNQAHYLVCLAVLYYRDGWRVSRRRHRLIQGMEADMVCKLGDVAHAVAARLNDAPLSETDVSLYCDQGRHWLRALSNTVPPYRGRLVLVTSATVDEDQKQLLKDAFVTVLDQWSLTVARKNMNGQGSLPAEVWDLAEEVRAYEQKMRPGNTFLDQVRGLLP